MGKQSNRDPKTGRFVSMGGSEVERLRRRVQELEDEVGVLRQQRDDMAAELGRCSADYLALDLDYFRLKERGFWARVFNR